MSALPLLVCLAFTADPPPPSSAAPEPDPLAAVLRTGDAPWQTALRDKEPLGLWHQIHWVPLADAVRLATAQHKPLLLSIASGSLGHANSPFT